MKACEHIKFMSEVTIALGFLTVWLILSGCSDTTGAGSNGDQNNQFTGRLYYHEGRYGEDKLDAYIKLDLKTRSSTILSTDRGRQYSSSQDETQFLVVDPTMTIINVYDSNGALIRALDIGHTIIGVPRLSYDKQYIAVQFKNEFSHKYLAILSASGEALNVVDIHETDRTRDGIQGIDWTPSGQIIYSAYGKVYRLSDITTDNIELIKSFESDFDIFSIRVSPDGKRLAFLANDSYVTTVEGGLYTMNIDGSDVNEITQTGLAYTFTYPAWAPDSRHLAGHFAVNAGGAECGVIWIFDTEVVTSAHIDENTSDSQVEGGYKIDTADYEVHEMCSGEGLDWH